MAPAPTPHHGHEATVRDGKGWAIICRCGAIFTAPEHVPAYLALVTHMETSRP
jgi:hypothetical protein